MSTESENELAIQNALTQANFDWLQESEHTLDGIVEELSSSYSDENFKLLKYSQDLFSIFMHIDADLMALPHKGCSIYPMVRYMHMKNLVDSRICVLRGHLSAATLLG